MYKILISIVLLLPIRLHGQDLNRLLNGDNKNIESWTSYEYQKIEHGDKYNKNGFQKKVVKINFQKENGTLTIINNKDSILIKNLSFLSSETDEDNLITTMYITYTKSGQCTFLRYWKKESDYVQIYIVYENAESHAFNCLKDF